MAHMKVYKDYMVKLVKALPMDDVTFTTQLSSNNILPDSVDAHIKSLPTESDKADYYLKHVIKKPLDIGDTEELNNLITVMEKCGHSFVERLAEDMKSHLDKELKDAETSAPSACFGVNMQSSPTQIKLFISYAWEKATNDFVVKLKTDLEAKGLQIFLDKHDILPGDNIQHEVAKGINEADGIIIVYSERYPVSQWCSQELQMAQNLGKKVFPIRRIKGPYQRNVNLPIGGILYANFTLDNEVEYQNSLASLIKGIEKNCVKEI